SGHRHLPGARHPRWYQQPDDRNPDRPAVHGSAQPPIWRRALIPPHVHDIRAALVQSDARRAFERSGFLMATDVAIATPAANRRVARKPRPTPLEYGRKRWLQVVVGFNFLFLYFPIVSLIAFSFNDSKRNVTWQGFTLKYYDQAFNNTGLQEAFIRSIG